MLIKVLVLVVIIYSHLWSHDRIDSRNARTWLAGTRNHNLRDVARYPALNVFFHLFDLMESLGGVISLCITLEIF